jgi:HD-GYP domain-containing protein (c-di-GMP phosphodiesterase class II)
MAEIRPLRRGRLLWTLVGVLTVVGVLPLIISNFFLIGINRESLETLEKKYLTRSAVGVSAEIQSLISSYTQQLYKIAGGIQTSAEFLPADSDPFTHPVQNSVISTYASSDPDLLAIRIVNARGQGSAVQPTGLGSEITMELDTAATAALEGRSYLGGFHYVSVANQPAIVLAVPVVDGNQVIGAVQGLVSLRRISERLREEAKGELSAFVVDRGGMVLMHSEPLLSVQRPNVGQLKIVQEFMKAPVRLTESYEDLVNGKPVKMLGTVSPVGGPDWGVIVQKEEAQAFASVRRMIRGTVQWSLVALLLACLVGFLFAADITRPIRELAATTRQIAHGNYVQRVDVRAKNEIGDLAENFNIMSEEVQKAVEGLKKAAHENHLLFLNSIRMLAAAIDAKDPYTRGHSERVARYSVAIGKQMGLTPLEMKNLRISALLHDVGKIGIDDRILRKPGALTEEEYEIMKRHPEKGAAIMGGVAQLADAIPGIKCHHEKWAGGGYPAGLAGEMIPLQARIVAVADTFDAMTTNRPYQKAMQLDYVVERILSFAGTRFDPRVVESFVSAVREGNIAIDEPVRGAA